MSKKKRISPKWQSHPRYLALEALEKLGQQQAYSNLLVNDLIKRHQIQGKDAGLLTELIYGTVSRRMTLEYYLAPFIDQTKRLDQWVKELLLLSLYQMLYLDRVPDYSVIHEAVEISKAKGNVGIGRFVNAILRRVQREGVPALALITDQRERLSIEASLPLWLVDYFVDRLGFDEARQLALSLLEPSRVSARLAMPELMSREAVIAELSNEGIEAEISSVSPDGIIAQRGVLARSPLFKAGQLTIQDESSMLVAPIMEIEKNYRVLDACAAPGGKTTHIASYLDADQGGQVVALDIHPHKIKLIEENAQRLGVGDVVKTVCSDARTVATLFPDQSFDRILVDAPCTGLGLLRRKPDIKYQKKYQDLINLQRVQLEILTSVAPKVKISGIITYSTCTITDEEDEDVIADFLTAHPHFELVPIQLDQQLTKSQSNGMLKLYPHHYDTDGFFISCLRRIK